MKKQIEAFICGKWQARLAAALLCASLMLPDVAHAATFTVTKLADTNDGACNADCSLREAITAANTAAGDDTVNFASGVTGAIDLTSTLPFLSTNIDIQGPGANLLTVRRSTASGTPDFRICRSWGVVSISGLTLSNGRATDANASGIDGTCGGAIATIDGILTIRNCVFSGNYAGQGGAIHTMVGSALIYNSTFSGNAVKAAGGAIFTQPTNNWPDSHVLIHQCTFSGNTSDLYGGGAIYNACPMTIEHSTFSGNSAPNGAGITNIYHLTIDHTILSNVGSNIENATDSYVQFTSLGYNLATDDGGGVLTGPGDLINTDPKLGPLQNNGGPTPTCALLTGSPAIDKGGPGGPATDQRGFSRPSGIRADIGAFEAGGLPALSVNNPRSLPEGSAASPGSITFDITLSAPGTQTVTVNYQTRDGINSPATAGVDYIEKHGKLTFAPGETLKRVTIFFIGDDKAEPKETFFLDLKTPTNAILADSRGVGTIVNDDATPSLFENDEPSQ